MIKSDRFTNFFGVNGTRLNVVFDESQRAVRLMIDGANPIGRLQKNGDIVFDDHPR